jgi:transcriptional regulator with XRE-family HTH domain
VGRKKQFQTLDAYLDGPPKRTQQQLAERLGITQSALSMIMNGHRLPSPDLALRLHAETGVPLETLLQRQERAAS